MYIFEQMLYLSSRCWQADPAVKTFMQTLIIYYVQPDTARGVAAGAVETAKVRLAVLLAVPATQLPRIQ